MRLSGSYQDSQGELPATFASDGYGFSLETGGVRFSGISLDDLEPEEGTDRALLARFTLAGTGLCNCTLSGAVPVTLHRIAAEPVRGSIHMTVTLGAPTAKGGLDGESVTLVLVAGELRLGPTRPRDLFEPALVELQQALPAGWGLQVCFGCAYSDYHPVGQGLIGSMGCFRAHKAAYLRVRGKSDLFEIWDRTIPQVHELHVCPEFAPRTPGTGYRG